MPIAGDPAPDGGADVPVGGADGAGVAGVKAPLPGVLGATGSRWTAKLDPPEVKLTSLASRSGV